MAERDLLVGALVGEVLGPRAGSREVLAPDQDPRDEYITGVLAPHTRLSDDVDSYVGLLGAEDSAGDDQADPGEDAYAPAAGLGLLPSPTLDPRSRPASIGLSFAVAASGSSQLSICCTWARYRRGDGGSWVRNPHVHEWSAVDSSRSVTMTPPSDSGVSVVMRSRMQAGRLRVTVYLVNATHVDGERPTTEEHVFQPQIRIRLEDGARLVPVDEISSGADDEEETLAFLYRHSESYARGHLCAATWKAVDPERPHGSIDSPGYAPFAWLDGKELLDSGTVGKYSPADVRTELVPVYQVSTPESGWPDTAPAPLLDPNQLAELWDAAQLRSALMPVVDGYEGWIHRQQGEASRLSGRQKLVADAQIAQCRRAAGRIRAGVETLVSSNEARLAFCFANRAISIQSRWTKGKVNAWWPFQLAFQLLNIRALWDPHHADREVCDLLWFPTGGGKTEAYLGLAAFTLALRRLRATHRGSALGGGGVTVLSRYTLRLLTIQQFRRALALITACEYLRVQSHHGLRGWRPQACSEPADGLWGDSRFSVGLWAGGGVTPNTLYDFTFRNRQGRLTQVYGAISDLEGRGSSEGEPAQVLRCPACRAVLAIPPEGYQPGERATLHFVVGGISAGAAVPSATSLAQAPIDVIGATLIPTTATAYATLSVQFKAQDHITAKDIDSWFAGSVRRQLGGGAWLVSARASRPGYFVRVAPWGRRGSEKPFEFETYCPNPACELNQGVQWAEDTPAGAWPILPAFQTESGRSSRCPIPAWTVDDQVYHRCPSVLIATVDKFARLSFESKAAALFGNVDRYANRLGYYRTWAPPRGPSTGLPTQPEREASRIASHNVDRFAPPDLILQDELHLIDGPLGSMVGIYESVVDLLAATQSESGTVRAKYIASTATVRRARDQIQAVFLRGLAVFPPTGIEISDSFFSAAGRAHPLDARQRGRLYVGISAPGRGAQTPIVRLWSRMLQHLQDRRAAGAPTSELDPYWTLVGYFNAMRELAGGVSLARQDIPQRIDTMAQQGGMQPRTLDEQEPLDISSRAGSMSLPGLLSQLEIQLGSAQPPVSLAVATSMFGTGVDVLRLGLMVVHGQPKMTSSYIQATGRVGRESGGVVVTLFRTSRPRDLSHYEYFTTYHAALYRFVEPVTVYPFAPRACDRALGPVSVALLRQAADLAGTPVGERWRLQQRLSGGYACRAHEMSTSRQDRDVVELPLQLEARAQGQPTGRQPATSATAALAASELDRWQQVAAASQGQLVYFEPTMVNPPSLPVVLGDLAHLVAQTGIVFEDAPNSLREVEATTTIRGWR